VGLISGSRERRYNGFTATFSQPVIPPNSASALMTTNMSKAENAMQKIAVWASVTLVAELAAEMPVDVFSASGGATRPLPTPGYLEDVAGDGYGTADWVSMFVVSQMLRGNAYGTVAARDSRGGFPTQVPLYHPDTVRGWRDVRTGQPVWYVNGSQVPADQMWHRRAYVLPGNLLGMSPIAYHASTIGLGLLAEQFGTEFFANGASPPGILTNTEVDISPTVAQTAKERFVAGMNGRREPVVLGKGWAWQQISIKPEESQFLATQGYTSAECARMYGPGMAEMLGYETGTPMTYQNDEQRNLHFLTYSLDRWLTKVERALTGMLPRPRYVKLNRNALLRTDLLTRYKAHALAIAARIAAPSEVREVEDMPPMTPEQLAELDFMPSPALKPISVTAPTK